MEIQKAHAMVLASFVADSLALGAHWIYDTAKIRDSFGQVDHLLAPDPGSYHSGKSRGDFTHYGDQALVLLESLASEGKFDLNAFARSWRRFFADYKGYVDKATKGTLINFENGADPSYSGSSSTDLAAVGRIAPLVLWYPDSLDGFLDAAAAQTRMTHNHPYVLESAEFFSIVAWKALQGADPVSALQDTARAHSWDSPIGDWLTKGMSSADLDTVDAIKNLGQSCHTQDAFPSVVHLIVKYSGSLREALIRNVMAGGDSAGRGMVVGMVLGAHLGLEAVPSDWMNGLKQGERIRRLMEQT